MNQNYLTKLEYNKILDILAGFCITDLGKELSLSLLPSQDVDEVSNNLEETKQAISLQYKSGKPPLSAIADITEHLQILKTNGVLNIKLLLEILKILNLSESLKNYFYQEYIKEEDFSLLSHIFEDLYTNQKLRKTLSDSILDEENLKDEASPTLMVIRQKQRKLESKIKENLNSFIHSPKYAKYIQEPIITIRNQRYVIPVKEEYGSQLKGLVHDRSSSGSTLFIEPLSIFELNNEINHLKMEEKNEIEKILQQLSSLLYPHTEELKITIEKIAKLDFLFAKASYSLEIDGITPNINKEPSLCLIDARHPLISPKEVVPVSIKLDKAVSTLVITGPNTGGKTVSLKTAGLLTCMACSGLNIPAKESSSIYVFDYIFADIGDDQSILESLSTFSSHILNIVDILKYTTKNSLVLLDELGSGTAPVEGANLAISILEHFSDIGSLTIATTHYQELKQYAYQTKGFQNASVEFDLEKLKPTYNLIMGIPGKSNAFEISKKLGLNEAIIQKASSRLNYKEESLENILKELHDTQKKLKEEKKQIEIQLSEIETLKKSWIDKNEKIDARKEKILEKAKKEARQLLLDTKEEVDYLIKNSNQSSSSELNKMRNELNKQIKKNAPNNVLTHSTTTTTPVSPSDIQPNMEVYVSTFAKNGIIVSSISKNNNVQVKIGSIKTTVPISCLEKAKKEKKESFYQNKSNLKNKKISSEINVIGCNVEEAIMVVDKFLDDASLVKLKTVHIVHGKGTGKLRTGIHDFLKRHPHVKSYRLGTFGEGEMGVTVVEIK